VVESCGASGSASGFLDDVESGVVSAAACEFEEALGSMLKGRRVAEIARFGRMAGTLRVRHRSRGDICKSILIFLDWNFERRKDC
jgi:hypothetical protein